MYEGILDKEVLSAERVSEEEKEGVIAEVKPEGYRNYVVNGREVERFVLALMVKSGNYLYKMRYFLPTIFVKTQTLDTRHKLYRLLKQVGAKKISELVGKTVKMKKIGKFWEIVV